MEQNMEGNFGFLDKYLEEKKCRFVQNILVFIVVSFFLFSIVKYYIKWWYLRKTLPPGPIGIPIFGSLPFLGSEPHKQFKEYGDIIGLYIGPTYTVVLNECTVMKEVLSNPAVLYRSPNIFHHIPHFGFITENGINWQEQRRFCMFAIKELGIGRNFWEEMVKEEVDNFSEFLKETQGKPTEIDHSLRISISSNIIAFLIGRRLDKVKEMDKIQLVTDFAHVVFSDTGPTNAISVIPALWNLLKFFKISDCNKATQIINNFFAFIRSEILRHQELNSLKVRDFMSVYLQELENLKTSGKLNHSFSESMLEGNTVALFVGSSDTIFSSMVWLLRLMSEHKDVQYKVYAELVTVLGKDKFARYEDRGKIPYTFAVVMEALRYSSFVPLSANRVAFKDVHVRGFIIPKGSEITANIWGIHNDTDYWDEPDKFKPDRFLTDNGTKLVKNPRSYLPFSIGRRNCPGETIAWMEILAYFTEIVKKFEISTPSGIQTEYNVVKGLLSFLSPQALCFKERKENIEKNL